MKRARILAILGVSLTTVSLSAMSAEDGKTFPGALCQPETGVQSVLRDSTGSMFNTSTAAQAWTCPVVRDVMGDEIEGAVITVVDRNVAAGDPNVSCTLYSRTPIGGLVASEFHSTAGGPGTVTLLYAPGNPNLAGAQEGYYYFRCSIPGTYLGRRSGIVSYRVVENDGED